MSSKLVMRGMIGFYIFLFFAYLFGPLLVMSITAFNTPGYPQAYPFEAFTGRLIQKFLPGVLMQYFFWLQCQSGWTWLLLLCLP